MTHSTAHPYIEIRTTTANEGTVDGHQVHRGGFDNIHAACAAEVVPRAQQAGRPILAHAVDTAGPQTAEFWIHIHPNGDVTDAAPPAHSSGQPRPWVASHDGINNGAERSPAPAPSQVPSPQRLPMPPFTAPANGHPVTSIPPTAVNSLPLDPGNPAQPYQPPTLNDLLAHRPPPPPGPAQNGWRALLRQLTGGIIKLPAGPVELEQRNAIAAVQRSLSGPKTVVVINPKGGADKTTATLLIAATFGIHRGGYTLAWDNNETRGTMGWRAIQGRHTNTAVDLLRELERFQNAESARVGDLDNFVRGQGSAQFDVLASDEDAASAASIDAEAFNALHRSLARFYRLIVVDTGNNMRASNWQAAVEAADQLVIVSTVREDTGQSAAWVADALNAAGQGAKVRNAVTVLAAPSARSDQALARRLHAHFTGLTRAVVDVPFDPSLVAGGPINVDALTRASRQAWLRVTALVADGL